MPTYRVTAPDGTVLRITAPEGATREQIMERVSGYKTKKSGDYYSSQEFKDKVAKNTPQDKYTSTGNFLENAAAGAGKAIVDTGAGIRQLWNRATGDKEELAQLQAQEAEKRGREAELMDTWGGNVGNIAAHAASSFIPVGAASKAGLLGKMLQSGAVGAGQSALAPTEREGELTENMTTGAALNAAIPAGGALARKMFGASDPVKSAAAQRLREMGIPISKVEETPGLISETARAIGSKTLGVGEYMAEKHANKTAAAREAIFQKLDLLNGKVPMAPRNKEELLHIMDQVGEDLGSITKGKSVKMKGFLPNLRAQPGMKDYWKLLPTQRSPEVEKYVQAFGKLARGGKGRITGQDYRVIRQELGREAARAQGVHKRALYSMQKALDDTFEKVVSPESAKKMKDLRSTYRVLSGIQNMDIDPNKGVDLYKMRSTLDRAMNKGAIRPDVRGILEDYTSVVPPVIPTSAAGTAAGLILATSAPALAAKSAAIAGVPYLLARTGVPQKLANNPSARNATTAALRGTIASKIYED